MTNMQISAARGYFKKIFGEHPGEGTLLFIRSLGWITVSFIAAKLVSSLTNIYAGRALGPREYGQVNVLVSAGALLAPFLTAGLNYSLIKYAADEKMRGKVFTTSLLLLLGLAALVTGAVFVFTDELRSLLGVGRRMLFLAFWYALSSGIFLIASCMQQSLGRFAERGISEVAFSCLLALGFLSSVFFAGRIYESMAYAYIAAFGVMGLFMMFRLRKTLAASLLDKKSFLEMLEYGGYYFGSGLAAFFTLNIQGLMLNSWLDRSEVGIYAAYYTATIGVAAYASSAVFTVLFPKASASTNRKRLWNLGAKASFYLAPAAFISFIVLEAAVLSLMGRHQYGLDPGLMSLFACCGTMMFFNNILASIVYAEGLSASRLALAQAVGAGVFNFAACMALIPRFRIAGAAAAFILTYAVRLFWLWRVKGRYLA